jgi:DGQHR domain-containing protein
MPYGIEVSEGFQGKHRYFTGNVPVGELEHMVKFPDEIEALDDDKKMQRGLAKSRIKDLVEYLMKWDDHFYSAVTLLVLPRDLSRAAVEFDESGEGDYGFERNEHTGPSKTRHGVLHLSGDVVLFPGDGQHRLKSEFEALKIKPEISKEELPVVLIPYESAEQVRQLFSDLNLNAKPVSKTVGYDFESRDPFALISKSLMQRVALFDDRVNRNSNSLSASSKNVVTLNTLVQGVREIVAGLAQAEDVPVEEYVENLNKAQAEVADVYQGIIDAFDPMWDDVLADAPNAAGQLREKYLFPHGLGWVALAKAAGALVGDHGNSWKQPFTLAVHAFDWHRNAPAWSGTIVLHNPTDGTNRVNNTGPAIQQLAKQVIAQAEALAPKV